MFAKYLYQITVIYRFALAFIIGYLLASYLALNITLLLSNYLNDAEAIYLAAFISIISFAIFVIYGFIIKSLVKFTFFSFIVFFLLYGLSYFLG